MTSTQFFELIVSISVQAALLVTATHWLGRLIDNERIQCRLWTGCYILLLALVCNAVLLPHLRLFHAVQPFSRPLAVEIVFFQHQIGRVLSFLWLVGCCVSLGLFAYRSIQAGRFLRTCQPVDPDVVSIYNLVSNAGDSREIQANRLAVRLVSSSAATSPFCWQFHQPFIVIPESLLTFESEQLRFILRHELEHLQTGHPLQVFLQRTVEIVFWFHPMVWWASQQSALTREFACDDAAVESRADIVKYLKTLLTIVEQNAAVSGSRPHSLAFVRNRGMMAERARRLVRIAQNAAAPMGGLPTKRLLTVAAPALLIGISMLLSMLWMPVNVLASPRGAWSPWPTWTAGVLHTMGVQARDFETYNHRFELHELLEDETTDVGSEQVSINTKH